MSEIKELGAETASLVRDCRVAATKLREMGEGYHARSLEKLISRHKFARRKQRPLELENIKLRKR